jgi:hypothetical protein
MLGKGSDGVHQSAELFDGLFDILQIFKLIDQENEGYILDCSDQLGNGTEHPHGVGFICPRNGLANPTAVKVGEVLAT